MLGDPMNLDEAGEWAGMWWLPNNRDEQVPGVLRYSPGVGLSLSLIGSFGHHIMSIPRPGVSIPQGTKTWDVIHGAAEQREITLLDCFPRSSKQVLGARVNSPDKQIVAANSAIIGAWVSSEEDSAFSAAQVSVEDLGRWAATSVFESLHGVSGGKFDGTGSIAVKPVEAQSVKVEGTEYRLEHRHTLPFFDERKGATVGRTRDTAFVRAVPAEPFSVGEAWKTARLVQDLVSLATHRAAGMIWLQVELSEAEPALPNGRPAPRRLADVLYSPTALGKHDDKAVGPRVFFTCASLPFEEVVPRWCEAHGRLQAATNMILGLRYAPASFIENNLLTAVGAAEVLHRNLGIDERPFGNAEFTAMRKAILTQVPPEHQDRIREAIRNDRTLRERLQALAARPAQEAVSLLVPDVDHWARRTTKARNDMAHEGRTPKHSIEELSAIVKVTTAVVILNVLHELGLPPDRQREIVQEHPQLRDTSQAARTWLAPPPAES